MSFADQLPIHAGAARPGGPPTLRRLLVGVDGSDAAGAACAFALWFAGKAGAEVMLVHACPELRFAAHAGHTPHPEVLVAAAEQRLAETAEWQRRLQNLRAYAADGASVESRVVRDRPAAALLTGAAELDSDVILVGSTGVGSVRGRFLGSVSSQVVDHAPCSLMVFHEGQPSTPAHVRSVVVGVDGSPGAADALAIGQQLAAALGAQLVLVNAYQVATALAPPTSELRSELRRYATGVLASARRTLGSDARVVEELHEGGARHVLVEACDRHEPSVLVVGTRGLGGFRGLLLGSTSRWVLNHAPCPVLVARRRPEP